MWWPWSVVDLGLGDLSTMTFWAHGLGLEKALACSSQEGQARQVTRAACVEAFVAPLINLLVNRSWDASAVARWTYVTKTLKKMVIGCVASRLLPEALRDLQLFWQVEASMETMLTKIVAADSGDFSSLLGRS